MSYNTTSGLRKKNVTRLNHAEKKLTAKVRDNHQRLRNLNIRKRKGKDSTYIAEAFSTSIHPDIVS